jgi:hypothetical protein
MRLDWDAPAFLENDPASPDLPPLGPFKVDYGPLAPRRDLSSNRPEVLPER